VAKTAANAAASALSSRQYKYKPKRRQPLMRAARPDRDVKHSFMTTPFLWADLEFATLPSSPSQTRVPSASADSQQPRPLGVGWPSEDQRRRAAEMGEAGTRPLHCPAFMPVG
jgi:hypothetical protein